MPQKPESAGDLQQMEINKHREIRYNEKNILLISAR